LRFAVSVDGSVAGPVLAGVRSEPVVPVAEGRLDGEIDPDGVVLGVWRVPDELAPGLVELDPAPVGDDPG
jgi:hypothetical protein